MRTLLISLCCLIPSLAFAGDTVQDSFNRYTLLPDGRGGWQYWPSDTGMTSSQIKQFQSALPQHHPLPVLPDLPPLRVEPIRPSQYPPPRQHDGLFEYRR